MKNKKLLVPHELGPRLRRLPQTTYTHLRRIVLSETEYSAPIWASIMNGVEPNFRIVIELCDAFQCSPRQLADPEFVLETEAAERYLTAKGIRV